MKHNAILCIFYGIYFIKSGGRFKKAYEFLNLRALKISKLYKNHIFQWKIWFLYNIEIL